MRILLLGVLLPLAACNTSESGAADNGTPGIAAQGTGKTRTYPVQGFSQIDLRGADNVDVRVGPGFSVRADGDSDLLDQLRITQDGTTLRVARRGGTGLFGDKRAKVSVTLPTLTTASIAGSGDMTIDRVVGASFKGAGAGSGDLSVAALQVGGVDLSLAGSGDMKLAGTAKQIHISIAGSGDIEAGGLTASGADVSVAGSGSVRADVDGPANVSVMGSGDVDLGGKAKCQSTKMGSGTIRCGG